jgi:hypothetical protein
MVFKRILRTSGNNNNNTNIAIIKKRKIILKNPSSITYTNRTPISTQALRNNFKNLVTIFAP